MKRISKLIKDISKEILPFHLRRTQKQRSSAFCGFVPQSGVAGSMGKGMVIKNGNRNQQEY